MEDQLFNDEMLIGIRTGAKLIEVKKTNGLVKLNKEFLGIELGFLNKKELELLYILCLAYKERKVQSIKIHIKEIKELMSNGEKEIRKTDIENYVETLHKRLAKVNIRADKKGISGTLNLFEYVLTDTRDFETGIVTIIAKITDTAMNFFNNLEGKKNKYLRFLVEDAIKLKGKYSALLLPHLISCSKDKEFEISFENLEEILGIKGKYSRKTDFNKRILKPTVEELEIIFKDLKVKGLKKNELDPRKITHYKFMWTNNINYDDKKEETSFYYELEETNSNDKKEYSKVFINDNNVTDENEKIIVAEAEEELTAEETIKKFINENIQTLNYKSIQKNIKSRLENGETPEEIIAFIKRNWHRAIENDIYKNKVAILIKSIAENFELNLTKEEIQKEKNILNGKTIIKREVKYIKSDWSNNDLKKENKEDNSEAKIENIKEYIDYKKYLKIKEDFLILNKNKSKDIKTELLIQRIQFNSVLKKYIINLSKAEYKKEIEDLKERFYGGNAKETEEAYKNIFQIINADEKEEIEEEEIEKMKEWEEEINKLPSVKHLSEVYYQLFCLYQEKEKYKENTELENRINNLQNIRVKLEKKLEEEKTELWNKKFRKEEEEEELDF
ncbi:replication initiation protein (plasmid) [Fusobacterium polymorphum ATCC 10953]|uniref:Possible replication protein n=2 Tax=Fusobacterium nucleatum subsp. polymorphum TaxID=76857 RepID=A5VW48_FUSNP|nr:replication initiation protein [Fusobacterium polymorphum]ABQ59639.1 possible replication protein [Fusobacterium polymorphum ATCC 10953]WRL69660.1 replication initiation protein [Fusobacterium polymorphum]